MIKWVYKNAMYTKDARIGLYFIQYNFTPFVLNTSLINSYFPMSWLYGLV